VNNLIHTDTLACHKKVRETPGRKASKRNIIRLNFLPPAGCPRLCQAVEIYLACGNCNAVIKSKRL
jgi:hypothetical protein